MPADTFESMIFLFLRDMLVSWRVGVLNRNCRRQVDWICQVCCCKCVCCKKKWHNITVTEQKTGWKLKECITYLSKTTRFYQYLHAGVISFQLHVPPGRILPLRNEILGDESERTACGIHKFPKGHREMYHEVMAPFQECLWMMRQLLRPWFTLQRLDDMIWYGKKRRCSFQNGPPSQKKMIPPTWGREYHSLQKNTNTKTSIWNLKLPYPPLCHWYL